MRDRVSDRVARERGTQSAASAIVNAAWTGRDPGDRAARYAAQGDLSRAAAIGGNGWRALAEGDYRKALVSAHHDRRTLSNAMLEACTLLNAGAIVAGLRRLDVLSANAEAAATIAIVRQRHQLGDHARAVEAARRLPGHAPTALVGARSALALDDAALAFDFIEPWLETEREAGDPATSAAIAVTTAALLAKAERHDRLKKFATRFLDTGDLDETMLPGVARCAWTAGLGSEAWKRLSGHGTPWAKAALAELALLAGDVATAKTLSEECEGLSGPIRPGIALLSATAPPRGGQTILKAGMKVHLWCTDANRWQPWIEAAVRTDAEVTVCDLAKNRIPKEDTKADAVIDDAALLSMIDPILTREKPRRAGPAWIGAELCEGIGIGHDWGEERTHKVREALETTDRREEAAVRIMSARDALNDADKETPTIVIAPPGDPFWAGPFPERVWPAMHVVRATPNGGWRGAAKTVIAQARARQEQPA